MAAQAVPLATLACAQPVPALQVSVVQTFVSSQLSVGGAQTPPAQRSGPVHALLSLHAAVLAVLAQPVSALQVSVVQTLVSLQFSAAPAVHTPAWQLSFTVQTLVSALHAVALATGVKAHAPDVLSQASDVHVLPSLHTVAAPD